MSYNFVKFGIVSSPEFDESQVDYPFFEENKDIFSEVLEFLYSDTDCFVITGLQGCGKSKILDRILSFVNPNVLLFKYQMQEATTLDDILLNMTIDFREYHKDNKATLPKIDTKDFRDRIRHYVKNVDKPMLLILKSYENILRFEDTAHIINDFLLHMASNPKVKILFLSRSFDFEILEKKNISYDRSFINSLSDDRVKDYLIRNNIFVTDEDLEEFTCVSRNQIKYIDMTIKLLQTYNISMGDLLKEFKLKKTSFANYLIGRFISLIPENSIELVYILALIRQSVSYDFLEKNGFYNTNAIEYLKKILILNEDRKNLYIKDYFKKELAKEIDQFATIKIHSFLEQLYSNMLPKKPFERELLISRTTMRREQAYHHSFIESYKLSQNKNEESKLVSEVVEEVTTKSMSTIEPLNALPEVTISIPKEKELIVDSIYNWEDYLDFALKYETAFDYSSAIFYYKKVLDILPNDTDVKKRPYILTKLANSYIKMHNTDSAIMCLNIAYELYSKLSDIEEANKVLLKLAIAYKNSYKFYQAKACVEKILKNEMACNHNVLSEVYAVSADIEDLIGNINEARELYKKALDYALLTNDKERICEAYFKYGLLLDDTHQQTLAIDNYRKCIETSTNPKENRYLSSAYTNLAGIFIERENIPKALHYYLNALEVDKVMQNNEGLYFVYTKLASLYAKSDDATAYQYLLNALQSAKRTKDNFYCASAYLEIGNYYYSHKAYKQSLKANLSAKHFIDLNESAENNENIERINIKLKELKIVLGAAEYNNIAIGYKYNE